MATSANFTTRNYLNPSSSAPLVRPQPRQLHHHHPQPRPHPDDSWSSRRQTTGEPEEGPREVDVGEADVAAASAAGDAEPAAAAVRVTERKVDSAVRRSAIKQIGKLSYSGPNAEGEDLDVVLTEFDRLCEVAGYEWVEDCPETEQWRLNQLLGILRNPVKTSTLRHVQEMRRGGGQVSEGGLREYLWGRAVPSAAAAEQHLETYRQGKNTSVQEHYDEFCRLLAILRAANPAYPHSRVVDRYLISLLPELSDHLYALGATRSLPVMKDHLLRYVHRPATRRSGTHRQDRRSPFQPGGVHKVDEPPVTCPTCAGPHAADQCVKGLTQQLAELKALITQQQRGGGAAGGARGGRTTRRRRGQGTLWCYNCLEAGHPSFRCPKPAVSAEQLAVNRRTVGTMRKKEDYDKAQKAAALATKPNPGNNDADSTKADTGTSLPAPQANHVGATPTQRQNYAALDSMLDSSSDSSDSESDGQCCMLRGWIEHRVEAEAAALAHADETTSQPAVGTVAAVVGASRDSDGLDHKHTHPTPRAPLRRQRTHGALAPIEEGEEEEDKDVLPTPAVFVAEREEQPDGVIAPLWPNEYTRQQYEKYEEEAQRYRAEAKGTPCTCCPLYATVKVRVGAFRGEAALDTYSAASLINKGMLKKIIKANPDLKIAMRKESGRYLTTAAPSPTGKEEDTPRLRLVGSALIPMHPPDRPDLSVTVKFNICDLNTRTLLISYRDQSRHGVEVSPIHHLVRWRGVNFPVNYRCRRTAWAAVLQEHKQNVRHRKNKSAGKAAKLERQRQEYRARRRERKATGPSHQ